MSTVALVLVYERDHEDPVPVARIDDIAIVADATRWAIAQAQARADSLAKVDGFLAEVERADVRRLRHILAMLQPDQRAWVD